MKPLVSFSGSVSTEDLAAEEAIEERRLGKNLEIMGLMAIREAQIIAVFISMSDQIAVSALSPCLCEYEVRMWMGEG
jgi:hypothetical protein